MKDQHIIELLDSGPLQSLAAEQVSHIREHVTTCPGCNDAFEAAQVATVVVKERARAVVGPSAFFQTRVLAALREQRANQNVPVLSRLWRSASVLVSTLALTTAALAALSFVVPGPTATNQDAVALNSYSAEGVILEQTTSDDQVTDDQVLNTIYADNDEAK